MCQAFAQIMNACIKTDEMLLKNQGSMEDRPLRSCDMTPGSEYIMDALIDSTTAPPEQDYVTRNFG